MATLLILLLGTVLIQGSAIAGHAPVAYARGVLRDEVRSALFTLITMTLASLLGVLAQSVTEEAWRTPLLLLGVAGIFALTRRALRNFPGATRWPDLLAHLTTQCALLGMALFSASTLDSLYAAFGYGVGAAVALALLSSAFAALRERLEAADLPLVFRGIPIALITAGFMALALMGFVGLIKY